MLPHYITTIVRLVDGRKTEPSLIPIEADFNSNIVGNTEGARLDVSCVGVWSPLEKNAYGRPNFPPMCTILHE